MVNGEIESPLEPTDAVPDADDSNYSLLIWDNDSSASQATVGVAAVTNVQNLDQCANSRFYNAVGTQLESADSIPYVSCDQNVTTINTILADIQTLGVPCAVFYSTENAGCSITPSQMWLRRSIPNIFTMLSSSSALSLMSIIAADQPFMTASINSNANSYSAPSHSHSALIALYVAMSIVIVVLLIILGCAFVRIRRHPERYNVFGPRRDTRISEQPPDYSTRARGLARAVLDSIPLVRVSRPTDTSEPRRRETSDADDEKWISSVKDPSKSTTLSREGSSASTDSHTTHGSKPGASGNDLESLRPLESGAETLDAGTGSGSSHRHSGGSITGSAGRDTLSEDHEEDLVYNHSSEGVSMHNVPNSQVQRTSGSQTEFMDEPSTSGVAIDEESPSSSNSTPHSNHSPALSPNSNSNFTTVDSSGQVRSRPILYIIPRGNESPVIPQEPQIPAYSSYSENLVQGSGEQLGVYEFQDEDQCPICFEEFQDGEILRALPCHHNFHAACVDPWLLNSASVCPFCRADLSALQGQEARNDDPPSPHHHRVETEHQPIVFGRTFLFHATHWQRGRQPRRLLRMIMPSGRLAHHENRSQGPGRIRYLHD